MNKYLSICIPTYNRADILKDSVQELIEIAGEFSVPICISDNASPDHTTLVIRELQKKYPYIFYSRNVENIGMDRNFEAVLKMARTHYAWLLGDDDRIRKRSVKRILEIINANDYDVIVVNGGIASEPFVRVSDVPSREFTDCNELLSELGWHMTWMSSLIYNHSLIEKANFPRYDGTFFTQVGVIFESLASKKDMKIQWCSSPFFYPAKIASLSWGGVVFEIFMQKWMQIIHSLPDNYSEDIKLKCIKDHGVKTGLFSLVSFFNLRAMGYYSYSTFVRYLNYYKFTTNVPLPVLFMISIFPKWPLEITRSIYKNREQLFRLLL